jgi:gluconolactonase
LVTNDTTANYISIINNENMRRKIKNFLLKGMRTGFLMYFIFNDPMCSGQEITSTIVARGARLEKLGEGYIFTEGPATDSYGNVYFTDQPNNQIVKWSTDGTVSVFMKKAGRTNGLCFDKNGNMIACSEDKNELWLISPDRKVTVLFTQYRGKRFNGPNDVWIAPNGNLYFTDAMYKRKWWTWPMPEQDDESVYLVSSDYKTITRLTNDLVRPNGIIGTPDGKTLYVADLGDNKTYSYRIGHDGLLYDKKLFAELGSDGMTIDNKGNIYMTGNDGVTVFDKKGKQILQLNVDNKKVGNICFAGKDHKLLFITASPAIYGLKMNVKGVGCQ